MDVEEYRRHDAVGLAELVAKGEVSAAELLAAARERTAAVNPRINAVVRTLDRQADERAAAPLTGPLAGVPFLIKDVAQDYAGEPTSYGNRALARRPAEHHSTVVGRWLDAGLVVFGKTNTPEFGAKGVTESELFGPARNPWNTACTTGGSSGGAAAAVAAGIVPVAGANDGAGSIRIPAACCGVFGMKVGRGVLPSGPLHGEGFYGAGVEGVVSRSVRDTAALLDAARGADPDAPYQPAEFGGRFLDEVGVAPGKLRIGVQLDSALNAQTHPQAIAAVQDAADLLDSLGHDVSVARVDYSDRKLAEDFLLPWFVRMATSVREAGGSPSDFELDTLVMAAIGRSTKATAHAEALERWYDYVRALSAFHREYDLLLTPTIARPPILVGELDTPVLERIGARLVLALRAGAVFDRIGIVAKTVEKNLAWVPYTQLANVTGRPAMSVPLYWTPDGLPLGVQFVAAPGGDTLLLRLAAQLEQARPWWDRVPSRL